MRRDEGFLVPSSLSESDGIPFLISMAFRLPFGSVSSATAGGFGGVVKTLFGKGLKIEVGGYEG